jgi:hypothetical protein
VLNFERQQNKLADLAYKVNILGWDNYVL